MCFSCAFNFSCAFHIFRCFDFSGMLFFSCAFHVLFTFQVLLTFQVCFSLFMCFSLLSAFHVLFTKSTSFHIKRTTFHENQQNQVNMCVYMYHLHIHAPHTPPNTTKYKIYLVGLPSVLYKTPGHNERSVLNKVFLLLFRCFS